MDVTPGVRRIEPPDLESVGQDEALVRRIRAEIERSGPITFARFMALALYDAEGGYYRSDEARPGREGDFLTAPEAHGIFGWALARAVVAKGPAEAERAEASREVATALALDPASPEAP